MEMRNCASWCLPGKNDECPLVLFPDKVLVLIMMKIDSFQTRFRLRLLCRRMNILMQNAERIIYGRHSSIRVDYNNRVGCIGVCHNCAVSCSHHRLLQSTMTASNRWRMETAFHWLFNVYRPRRLIIDQHCSTSSASCFLSSLVDALPRRGVHAINQLQLTLCYNVHLANTDLFRRLFDRLSHSLTHLKLSLHKVSIFVTDGHPPPFADWLAGCHQLQVVHIEDNRRDGTDQTWHDTMDTLVNVLATLQNLKTVSFPSTRWQTEVLNRVVSCSTINTFCCKPNMGEDTAMFEYLYNHLTQPARLNVRTVCCTSTDYIHWVLRLFPRCCQIELISKLCPSEAIQLMKQSFGAFTQVYDNHRRLDVGVTCTRSGAHEVAEFDAAGRNIVVTTRMNKCCAAGKLWRPS